jgi:hypothetical protein
VPRKQPFVGALHLSATSLTNVNACPGDTRRAKSAHVTTALIEWVLQHGIEPDFLLDVTGGETNGDPCHVLIARAVSG